jgi:hypothetical protein
MQSSSIGGLAVFRTNVSGEYMTGMSALAPGIPMLVAIAYLEVAEGATG